MTNQQQVPSQVIRQVCDSIIDNLGEKSLRLLFAQAKLQRFYSGGELPPADDSPSATVDELSHLFAVAFRIFGDRGMRPILLRAGRNSLKHFRETNKALSVLAGAAFKLLPIDARIKLVLSRSAKVAEELLHAPHRTYDTNEGFFVEISACPYCAGTSANHGICYFPIGFYGEALRWATGDTYPVSEVECIAAGAPHCRIRIERTPEQH
jgi:predicted hydrocarbon binding protein